MPLALLGALLLLLFLLPQWRQAVGRRPFPFPLPLRLSLLLLPLRSMVRVLVEGGAPGPAVAAVVFTSFDAAVSVRRVHPRVRRLPLISLERLAGCCFRVGHSPAGGDARHDDALRPRGGHSLESPLPKLLKEQLLLQLLEAAGAALRSRGRRGATGAELERTRRLHLRLLVPEKANQS